MAGQDRRDIIVDDEDAGFTYHGSGWFVSNESFPDPFSASGIPYRYSQHGVRNNASLSFTFEGSYVDFSGTWDIGSTPGGGTDPSWDCYYDGTLIPKSELGVKAGIKANSMHLCGYLSDALPPRPRDGVHTVTINITSSGRTFWIDRALYYPLENLVVENYPNATVVIMTDELAIRLEGSWRHWESTVWTEERGASLSLNFTGSRLWWSGVTLQGFDSKNSTGSFSIDGGPKESFTIPGLSPSADKNRRGQVMFETETLDIGPHNIRVTYEEPGAPLALDDVYVENGDILLRSPDPSTVHIRSSPSDSETPSTTSDIPDPLSSPGPDKPSPSTNRRDGMSPASIVGAVVGSVAFVLTLAFLVFLYWKRKWKRRSLGAEGGHDELSPTARSHHEVEPFDTMVSGGQTMAFFNSSGQGNNNINNNGAFIKLRAPRPPSPSPPPTPHAHVSEKQRQRPSVSTNLNLDTVSAGHTRANPSSNQGPDEGSVSEVGETSPAIVNRHEDSGLRDAEVVDLPPLYSER